MRKFCFLTIAIVALMVAGSSTAFAADNDIPTDGSAVLLNYWQADTGSSVYSFVTVTNPSNANNATRDVTVTAIQTDGSLQTGSGVVSSAVYNIGLGKTIKIFIAMTNHSIINPTNISGVNFLTTTGSGVLKIVTTSNGGADNITVWGAIVIPGTGGFAMEAIGDLADSTGTGGTGGHSTGL